MEEIPSAMGSPEVGLVFEEVKVSPIPGNDVEDVVVHTTEDDEYGTPGKQFPLRLA